MLPHPHLPAHCAYSSSRSFSLSVPILRLSTLCSTFFLWLTPLCSKASLSSCKENDHRLTISAGVYNMSSGVAALPLIPSTLIIQRAVLQL